MRDQDNRINGESEAANGNLHENELKVTTTKTKASVIRKSIGGWTFASLLLGAEYSCTRIIEFQSLVNYSLT